MTMILFIIAVLHYRYPNKNTQLLYMAKMDRAMIKVHIKIAWIWESKYNENYEVMVSRLNCRCEYLYSLLQW